MSDHTANGAGHHGHGSAHGRAPRAEFRVYFALIFAASLPFATIGWVAFALRHGRLPEQGPLGKAWCDARTITPNIFRP